MIVKLITLEKPLDNNNSYVIISEEEDILKCCSLLCYSPHDKKPEITDIDIKEHKFISNNIDEGYLHTSTLLFQFLGSKENKVQYSHFILHREKEHIVHNHYTHIIKIKRKDGCERVYDEYAVTRKCLEQIVYFIIEPYLIQTSL